MLVERSVGLAAGILLVIAGLVMGRLARRPR